MLRFFVFMFIMSAIGTVAMSDDARFPTITAEDLNFREVTIPQEFPGEKTVVLIAYLQRQQPLINDWVAALGLQVSGGQPWVELPTVNSAARPIKGFIDNGMRSGIVDESMRARTITIYGRQDINKALGVRGTSQVQAAVITRDGEILALASGDVTPKKAQAILDALER